MHEMSLCEGIVEILEEQAEVQGYRRVRTVRIEVGPLACVEAEALRFAFDAVTRNTLADGAILEILETEGLARCPRCGVEVPVQQRYDACPQCGGHPLQIIRGEELRIKDLEVD